MKSEEEEQGVPPPKSEDVSSDEGQSETGPAKDPSDVPPIEDYPSDDPYDYYGDTGAGADSTAVATTVKDAPPPAAAEGGGGAAAPPAGDDEESEDDGDEEGMLRMSFLEHLEELRTRLLLSLAGLGVSFLFCLIFANDLWKVVSEPAVEALKNIGAEPTLAQLEPMDAFMTIWVKVPMLAAIFLASPWILYQVWAFIAPGLYRRERRWAGPFVVCTAGLFILGGLFAYFVAFRFGLEFLLSIGRDINVKPVVSLTKYFDLFVNVTLGIGLVFELPILLFFLTLLRIVTPRFLLRNTRYAILIIVIIAAIVTPTPDVFNLMLFSVPMTLLYFVGIFASYLLVLNREQKRLPWGIFLAVVLGILLVLVVALYLAAPRFGYHIVPHWPFLTR